MQPLEHIAKSLQLEIESLLSRTGLLYRVYSRAKAIKSIENKITKGNGKYQKNGKLIQDLIGLRIVLYFSDDIKITEMILKSKYVCDEKSSTIDEPTADTFAVTRHNLIFKAPRRYISDFEFISNDIPFDTTFEVQLRTTLSEGWHEIEHDLRYKCPDHWADHQDLSRALNGIVATLETAEWSLDAILNKLAHRHYKRKNWCAMTHTILRMRTTPSLSKEICTALNNNENIAKSLFRIKRHEIIRKITSSDHQIPITLDNLVYVWNYTTHKYQDLIEITPELLLNSMRELD